MKLKNSSAARVLSASAASWMRIFVTVFAQIALVPIYLSSWNVDVYGVWLLIQGIWAIVIVVDVAHQDYIGYECLRLGESNSGQISLVICSAAPIALIIGVWDFFLVWQFGNMRLIAHLMDVDSDLVNQGQSSLLLLAGTWFLVGGGGLINRWVIPLGYNAQVTWFGVLNGIMSAITPAVAVFYGCDLLEATLSLCCSSIIFCFIYYTYMWLLMGRLKLKPVKPNLKKGAKRALKSLWIAAKSVAEIVRQQGIRIVLAPLIGITEMVAFSTMRTGSNFALQGLNTVTGPIMPEMMRYLAAREQNRLEGAFSIVWMVLCGVVAPSVVLVQYLAPILFPIWTNNKINYDPWLFGALSLAVLVFGLAQPGLAIIQGKNSVIPQLFISGIAALIVLVGCVVLGPVFGARGVAFMMLIAEVASLTFSIWWARELLLQDSLQWPWRAFRIVSISVISVGIELIIQEYVSSNYSLLILCASMATQLLITIWYWNNLPNFIHKFSKDFMYKAFRFNR